MVAKQVKLNFVAWTWNPDFVRKILDVFENTVGKQDDLEVTVDFVHYEWADYPEKVLDHLADGKPIDALYVSDDWLSDWAASGLVLPLEDYRPEIRKYCDDLEQFNTQGMSYKDKLYGLPYYCDRFGLVFNEAILEEAGIDAPPNTWPQLADQCRTITSRTGMQHPLILPLGFGADVIYPVSLEILIALISSQPDGWCFTPDLMPSFGPDSATAQVLQWCLNAQDELNVLDPSSSDKGMEGAIGAMQSGNNAFTVVATYCLKEINNPEHTRWPGTFKLALMPETGYTVGYSRFYAITDEALQRGEDHFEATWRLVEFLGGRSDPEQIGHKDYYVMRRWILEDGLGFAQKKFFSSPDVRKVLGEFVDVELLQQQASKVRHKRGMEATWWRKWYIAASETIKAAMKHKISCEEALDKLSADWYELKSSAGRSI